MELLKSFLLVPVVMLCALGGTVGLIWLIRRFSPEVFKQWPR